MAEITMNDLKDTYIKLTKDVPVYSNPTNGDKGKPVWWTKKKGEIAGKLFMWITPNAPMQFASVQNAYLIFKLNDDFNNPNAYWYFIKYDTKMIDWAYSKNQLAAKQYADMSLWEKFVTTMEKDWQNVVDNAKSGLKWGLIISGVVLLVRFVVVPEIRWRRQKGFIKEVVREAKK